MIYTRVSTDDQATKGNSLFDQEELLRKACTQDHVEIIDHIQDDGYSAKTFNRPGFQRFLDRLQKGQTKVDFLYEEQLISAIHEPIISDRRLKIKTNGQIQRVQGSLVQLSAVDTNYMKYCRFNLTFLTHLPTFYKQASTAVRKKILGSIFTGKLIFKNGNYRTTGLNEAVSLIWQFQQEFGHKKAEHFAISDKTFGNVPMTGQLSNHIVEGMRKIYELETFMKKEASVVSEGNKGSKIYKKAV